MSSSQPYNIGIISAIPFEVVAEYAPPLFQRGLLHVFFPSLQAHAFIAHLHAHSSVLREQEARFLTSLVFPLIQQNQMKVLVMGDLNSLFHRDVAFHGNWSQLFKTSGAHSSSPIIKRLKKKFCHDNSSEINYNPLDILIAGEGEGVLGLKDSCSEFCRREASATAVGKGSIVEDKEHEKCYRERCSYSEPTAYNPEVCACAHVYVCLWLSLYQLRFLVI
jgi:hypothetical protein